MTSMRYIAASLLLLPSVPAWSDSAFGQLTPVSDARLDTLRGGVMLPNGLDVAIGIDIQTLVNGQLALHTVVSTQNDTPAGLRVLVGDRPDPMATGRTVVKPSAAAPELLLDRRGTVANLTVSRSPASGPGGPVVNVLSAPRESWPRYPGETEIAPVAGGPTIATPQGQVGLTETDAGRTITLSGDGLRVSHLVGQASGVLVANTVNDRVIESVTTIDVDLKGSWAPIANGVFSVNAIAAEAVARR